MHRRKKKTSDASLSRALSETIRSKRTEISVLQQPIPMCVHVLVLFATGLFYLITFGLYMNDIDGNYCGIKFFYLWNVSCIILYSYIIVNCILFAWECKFERINMEFHPELYNIKERERLGLKVGTKDRKVSKLDVGFTTKLSVYFSMFSLDWSENGIICMFTMIYSLFSSGLIWYRFFTENHQQKYILIGIRDFLGAFALCFPEICLIYYHKGIARYEHYVTDIAPNAVNPPSLDTSAIALKQSIFSEKFIQFGFLAEFLMLFLTYQMMVVWNHENYTNMISDMYGCNENQCSTNMGFIMNELIFHTFPGWVIGNTIIHIIMMQSDYFYLDTSNSYSEIKHIITPSYLVALLCIS